MRQVVNQMPQGYITLEEIMTNNTGFYLSMPYGQTTMQEEQLRILICVNGSYSWSRFDDSDFLNIRSDHEYDNKTQLDQFLKEWIGKETKGTIYNNIVLQFDSLIDLMMFVIEGEYMRPPYIIQERQKEIPKHR